MKYKLDEKELELMKRVSAITITDYEVDNKGYIEIESLICAIEDLEYEIDRLNEKYEDLKQDIEDNYKPISRMEQVD